MTREEIIHIFDNSRLVSEHFDSEAVTAAYIEGLAALREQEQRRWIPVTERLPEENGQYLVVACDEGCTYGEGIWYDTVVVVADYWNKGCWSWYDGNIEYDLTGIITHWMPLPEPPKEDAL